MVESFAYYYPSDNKYWHNKGKWTGLDIDVSISFMCLFNEISNTCSDKLKKFHSWSLSEQLKFLHWSSFWDMWVSWTELHRVDIMKPISFAKKFYPVYFSTFTSSNVA